MLTRRHIRVKVLQSVYAFNQSEYQDLDKQEKFLLYSIDQMQDLYALMLQLLVALRDQADIFLEIPKKASRNRQEKNPSRGFYDNKVIQLISTNPIFQKYLKIKNLTIGSKMMSMLHYFE